MSKKTCSKCTSIFPATTEYFYKEKINTFGDILLKGKCKKCCKCSKENSRKYNKTFYDKNSEAICKTKMQKYILQKHGIQILK